MCNGSGGDPSRRVVRDAPGPVEAMAVNVSKASVGQGGMSGFDQIGASDRFAETQTKWPDVELPRRIDADSGLGRSTQPAVCSC